MRGAPGGGSPPIIIVSSGSAGSAGRFREQRKHSAAILQIEKGPQTFFDNLSTRGRFLAFFVGLGASRPPRRAGARSNAYLAFAHPRFLMDCAVSYTARMFSTGMPGWMLCTWVKT